MNSTVFCVLLAVGYVAGHKLTYVDQEMMPSTDKPSEGTRIEKKVEYSNGKTQTVTLLGKEVRFTMQDKGAAVLDYAAKKIIFNAPQKKGICYIAQLKDDQVPLEEIESKLNNQKEKVMDFPRTKIEINARRSREVKIQLGTLGEELCAGLQRREVYETTALSTDVRGKREVGFWEVVVIVVVIILLF